MKKFLIGFCLLLFSGWALGQKVTLDPTITPSLFRYNTPITVTYDVTGTALANLTAAWAWVWIPGNTAINAQYNINPATSGADNAKFTKSTSNGKTLFTITFTPSAFFSSDISLQTKMGILLKANDWPNGQTSDYLATFWDGSFQTKLESPTQQPLFVSNGDVINVQAETPITANFSLSVNNQVIDTQTGLTVYTYQLHVSDTSSYYTVKVTATATASSTVSFSYLISSPSPVATRPAGIIDGINYSGDQTKATLSLWAPQKSSVYVLGDFTNWAVSPAYQMNKDGEHFWLEIDGLTPGTEYGFQYLVDETLFVADPYADKILDPDDQYIPASTYPNLKAYPAGAQHNDWYFNRVSVLQTGQTPYVWQAASYQRPAKEKLVIYELLVRDFFDSNHRNYQTLIDTISYFKKLGVTAIELMPVTEFNGNDSWGYNPTFMFAPDKYYGTKNKLKEFIDLCHQNNMAVILDIVMNHQDIPNTYAMMYFDFSAFKPTANNPWFNVNATHPYSVFNDMNHASTYTKKYLDTVNYHWLHDYKVDGLRFDLSKGFTQTNNPNDVNAWGAYDASRIAILKRMSDVIWSYAPDTYVILEHFAANTEEKELAEYRSNEGKGMMLWENYNNAYNQNTMGFSDASDFSSIYYANKGWTASRAVGYMESHDEERLMYKNLQFGNVSGSYNIKSLNTALARVKAASVLFYTIPGPKMLWEFGELGYDQSINTCTDGTINSSCRISAKPVLWSYQTVDARQDLHNLVADLNRLRKDFSVFSIGDATIASGTNLVKQISINGKPYTATPSDSTQMNVQIVANMDMVSKTVTVGFVHEGTWYDYYTPGTTIQVSGPSHGITLAAGQYKLYTDVAIANHANPVTEIAESTHKGVTVYPNPSSQMLFVESENIHVSGLTLRTLQGIGITPPRVSENAWDVHDLAAGLYFAEIRTEERSYWVKVIKNNR